MWDRQLQGRVRWVRRLRHSLHPEGSPWRAVAIVAATLLLAAVVPSPAGRRECFEHVGPDKLLHFLGHAALSGVLVDAMDADRGGDARSAVLAVVASTTWGVLTGSVQERIPGRRNERADLVAALAGSIAGVVGWRTAVVPDGEGGRHVPDDRSPDEGAK